MEAQTWLWNDRINSLFLYDTNGVLDLMCVWFIFACFVLLIFFLLGNKLLLQAQVSKAPGNSWSLGEKLSQKKGK